MNLLLNIILMFVFIFLSLIIGVPGTGNNNPIKNKAYLFFGIFIFQLLIDLVEKIRNKCKVEIRDLIQRGVFIATISVIGYSIYIDLSLIESTKTYLKKVATNRVYSSGAISITISLFTLGIRLLEFLIKGANNDCVRYV